MPKKGRVGFKFAREAGSQYIKQLEEMVAKASERARDLSGNNHQVVRTTALDESDFRRRAKAWPRFHELAEEGRKEYPQFEDLLVDVYFALYQYEPRLRDASSIAPSHRLNRQLLHQAMALDLWEQARLNGMLNQGSAMIALVYIAKAILDGLPEEVKATAKQLAATEEERELQKQRLEALIKQLQEEGLQDLTEEELEALGDGSPADNGKIQALVKQIQETMDGAGELDDEARAAATAQIDLAAEAVRRAARRGVKEGVAQQNAINSALASWGEDPAEWNALPIEERMALAERMQRVPNLKDFLDEIGRMQQMMIEARQQPNAHEAQEITDITLGGRLSEVVASERLLLAHRRLRKLFYLKLAQNQLLVNHYEGKEPSGKGPLIMVIDVSGSTMGAPERWAKGFAMAGLDLCRRDDRDAGIAFFDTQIHPEGTFVFPKGRAPEGIPTLALKCQVVEFYTGGGTDFRPPLEFAISQIEMTDGEWEHADIVIVTDGVCDLPDDYEAQFRERCAAKNVRVHGVLLDIGAYYLESLKGFCHNAWAVSTLAGAKHTAGPIFTQLVA